MAPWVGIELTGKQLILKRFPDGTAVRYPHQDPRDVRAGAMQRETP